LDAEIAGWFAVNLAFCEGSVEFRLPFLAQTASNWRVNTLLLRDKGMVHSLLKYVVGTMILATRAYGQITPEPPASAVVSPSNETSTGATHSDATGTVNSSANEAAISEIEPGQPTDSSIAVDPISLLPDLKPLPTTKATLVGGTIGKLDRVRDEIVVDVYGGGRQKILFDPRTRIYAAGKETTSAELREGERIYLDTVLDGDTVFARSIRLNKASTLAESQGVVVRYRADRGDFTMHDSISPAAIRVRMTPSTRVMQGDRPVGAGALMEGSLIAVKFTPEGNGREVAREVSILAQPGVRYTFVGQLIHLDMRTGLMVLNSSTDHKTYEIHFDPTSTLDENLQLGATVTVITNLEGWRYVAKRVTVDQEQPPMDQQQK
jgi:hypothetical protein